ncbi:acetylxylan esterase [Lacinutrix sp. C3R15]|uniref:alpha/beta hydrolase family protein n=1 Tax=Flavobacteriaceae TaxID=49546 RepID=UPI001C0A1719|nr:MULTISPECIES: acetylxylan esterase [Flavobacteriaceae]MBU2939186.1 acetylxylan esterase [Lacinutrix sp. C3R15]MDO6622502.1 acetylxylan esterase [Oceanihabitans sp. 1_MG-2023]
MKYIKSMFLVLFSAVGFLMVAQSNPKNLVELLDPKVLEAPKMYWEPSKDQGDIKALFYETLDFKGKPTRAFAYLGIPKSDEPVPAMVLVHGGGGRAFQEWVKIWNDKGYAAIAMSLEGYRPDETGSGKFTHEYSGPQRVGRFDDIELPLKEQWMYHAVSDILLAHSLLEDMPEIDANAIGITGISWGGVLSSLVSGIDDRLKCAIPVYGAGFLYESKGHFGEYSGNNPELEEKKKFWDPAHQFTGGSVPTLWVNGDSDAHFSLNITSHSFEVTEDHAFMSVHPSMRHGHPPGWKPNEVPEIYAFADYMLKGKGFPLGQIIKQPTGRKIKMKYTSEVPLTEATVYYLNEELTYRKIPKDAKHPQPSDWQKMAATINAKKHTVKAKLPKGIKTYYVNLKDERGLIISSKLVQL